MFLTNPVTRLEICLIAAGSLGLLSDDSPLEHAAAPSRDVVQSQRTIHTMCTSNGSPYLNFQTRIM